MWTIIILATIVIAIGLYAFYLTEDDYIDFYDDDDLGVQEIIMEQLLTLTIPVAMVIILILGMERKY